MIIDGIIVLYNPETDIYENISNVSNTVNKLFICDNSTKKNTSLISKIKKIENLEYLDMEGNKGIAYALKVGVNSAISDSADYCLTLDQDSIFPFLKFDEIKEELGKYKNDKYGIVSLNFNDTLLPDGDEVDKWITSGNYINIKNYKLINGFNEKLFIDLVDFELDEQFASIGKNIKIIKDISIVQKIGTPIKRKFFWKNVTCMNHSPLRYYYRYRNTYYLYKKNKEYYRDLHFGLKKDFIKMIFFEKNKLKKIKFILKAKKDARKGKLGKYISAF